MDRFVPLEEEEEDGGEVAWGDDLLLLYVGLLDERWSIDVDFRNADGGHVGLGGESDTVSFVVWDSFEFVDEESDLRISIAVGW